MSNDIINSYLFVGFMGLCYYVGFMGLCYYVFIKFIDWWNGKRDSIPTAAKEEATAT